MLLKRLPSHYLELLSDALLKVYWYKSSFRAALRRAEVPDSLLATWAADETKRDFWERVMPSLETSDQGIRTLVRLADAVGEQKSFPDLERMEDSALRIKSAKEAIAGLNDTASVSATGRSSKKRSSRTAKGDRKRARRRLLASTA